MFDNYLENPETYLLCQQYWDALVQRLAGELGQTGEWRRWISPYFGDGKTAIDVEDRPIFDGRSDRLNRAFRILQYAPIHGIEIGAWISSYEEEFPDLPAELIIHLAMSESTVELAELLLKRWMTPDTTVEAMQSFIQHCEATYDARKPSG